MYLITVKYDNDAERKRLEYVFEKWADKLMIIKPEGIVAIVDESVNELAVQGFVKELFSKSSITPSIQRDNISVFRIQPADFSIERQERGLSLDLHEKRETVEKLLGFIMAKQKAILKRESDLPPVKTYELTTKKGTAEISTMIRENDEMINISLTISGYGEVVDFVYDKLKEELKYFGV